MKEETRLEIETETASIEKPDVSQKTSFGEKTGFSNTTGFTGKERNTILRAMSMMSQIAFTVIACVALSLVIGRFLDNYLGTAPWLLIVFLLLGIVSAFKAIIDMAKKF